MLSFEKCKELFDAGLRRESVKAGDMFYTSNGVFLVFVKGVIDGTYTTTYVKDGGGTALCHSAKEISEKFTPVFILEELVSALYSKCGIDYIRFDALTVEHAADVYLGIMKTSVPEKPLEIKLGGIYRMRNGGAAMVYAVYKDGAYPVRAIDLGCSIFLALTDAGRYVVSGAMSQLTLFASLAQLIRLNGGLVCRCGVGRVMGPGFEVL